MARGGRAALLLRSTAALALLTCSPMPARSADAPPDEASLLAAGGRLYMHCIACHSLAHDAGHSAGPNLWGLFGSTAGTRPDFAYSEALATSGIVWSTETIGRFIENPAGLVPGTTMAFAGIAAAADRRVLLAYLVRMTAAP